MATKPVKTSLQNKKKLSLRTQLLWDIKRWDDSSDGLPIYRDTHLGDTCIRIVARAQ